MKARPRHVLHADWSKAERKRWAAEAELRDDGVYVVRSIQKTTPDELLPKLRQPSTLAGFDFPIGLPARYAALSGIQSFTEFLGNLGSDEWSSFSTAARTKAEIGPRRPFYPHASGGKSRQHLVDALGLQSWDDLYRRCEIATGRRACPLFWTLGGNQVGKAALTGWTDVIRPARKEARVNLWPFDGSLDDLLSPDRAVIVETYPGDVYSYIGADGVHKRKQSSRASYASQIVKRANATRIEIAANIVQQLRDGFGADAEGEDRFDAIAGLLGMLAVIHGERNVGIPAYEEVHRIEGWILGRLHGHEVAD
jgi:hypothetical protein